MSSSSTTRTAAIAVARFGLTYGYRLDGDSVELNASFQLINESAHQLQWILQLHASPADTTTAFRHATHLVAEVQLPPMAELTGATETFALVAAATPPAGEAEFNLTLSLVGRQPGRPDEVHDVAIFARPERFIQPRLNGEISCDFVQNEVRLSLDTITNPRDPANISGTLSLELWALTTPYTGGTFEGMPLAGVILGRLSGQQSWSCASYALHYAPPIAGQWNVALMLREWTGSGYTTRDYRNLPKPLLIAKPASIHPKTEVTPSPAASPTIAIKAQTSSKKPTEKTKAKDTAAANSKALPQSASKKSSPASRKGRSNNSL